MYVRAVKAQPCTCTHAWIRACASVWLSLVVYPSVSFCFIFTKIAQCLCHFGGNPLKNSPPQHGKEQVAVDDLLNDQFP